MQAHFLPDKTERTAETAPETVAASVAVSDASQEAAVAPLLETAEKWEQKRRTVEKAWNAIGLATIAAFFLLISAMIGNIYTALLPAKLLGAGCPFLMAFNAAIQMGFRPLRDKKCERLQKAVAALLKHSNEPRLLLPLLDALNTPQTPEWESQSYPALIEKLWNLSSNDAALSFDDTRRQTLRRTLSNAYPLMANGRRQTHGPHHFNDVTADLAVAIMKTLAQLGDTKSVGVLQKIIKSDARTRNEEVVRDAACAYLPALEQKIAENKAARNKIRDCLSDTVREPQKVLAKYLDTLPAEDAQVALVDFLRYQRRRDLFSRSVCYAVALLLGYCAYLFFVFVIGGDKNRAGLAGVLALTFGVPINLLLSQGQSLRSSDTIQRAIHELSHRAENDTRFIALFLHAAQRGLKLNPADGVNKTLVRLLPLLKPGDAALVPPAQQAYLRSWLRLPRTKKTGRASHTLTISALDALAAIGDTRALPKAEQIARRTHADYRDTELNRAAVRCADTLRARKTR